MLINRTFFEQITRIRTHLEQEKAEKTHYIKVLSFFGLAAPTHFLFYPPLTSHPKPLHLLE